MYLKWKKKPFCVYRHSENGLHILKYHPNSNFHRLALAGGFKLIFQGPSSSKAKAYKTIVKLVDGYVFN